ncbi:MAG: His/Gly/Thr/Pro-type tRNA ligase C-terminal domain-containing protein [Simkaniaceae bacterium]|nr:His/Gly/Thr/Pro-type tRNA ligase C-terminal domain-containing protein [Candidatus Sacchlamyda saccharinae]
MFSGNKAAAVLLGVAVRKIFPQSTYLGSDVDERGFYAFFHDSAIFQKPFLDLLENEMRELGKLELESKEMLASNAKEFLIHHNEKALAKTLEGVEGIVEVVTLGECVDLCEGPLKYSRFFSLLGFEQEKGKVCIHGVAFETQKEQKNFLKLYRDHPKNNAISVGKDLELFEEPFWHPRGVQFKRVLQEKWRRHLSGFCEIQGDDPKEYFTLTKRKKTCLWQGDRDHIYSFEKDSLISCLQIIGKWIKIFDFEARWVIHGKLASALKELKIDYVVDDAQKSGVTVYIADGLRQFWPGPTLERDKEKISFSLFGDLEKFIHLVLERFGRELPFWLAPEQVRLLPLEGVDFAEVLKNFEELSIRYSVDQSQRPLKEKMHRALQVNVPCVIVFGKQEEETGKLKVRVQGSQQNQTLTMQQMKNFLSERKFESQ